VSVSRATGSAGFTPRMDFWLLAGAVCLGVFGVIMVLSASGVMAEKFYDDKYHFFFRQLAYLGMGLGVMTGAALVPLERLCRRKYWILGVTVLLLCLPTFTPLGVEINGARRWI